jgi:hypothetical protein
MFRKSLVVLLLASVTVGIGLVAGTGVAQARRHPVNVTINTIRCIRVYGSVSFSPKVLTSGTTSGTCTLATPLSGLRSISGYVSGSGTLGDNQGSACTTNFGPAYLASGALTVHWMTRPAGFIVPHTSVFTPGSIAPVAGSPESFDLPGLTSPAPTVTGAFEGTNSGNTSSLTLNTNQTSSQIATHCSTGISGLNVASGVLVFS